MKKMYCKLSPRGLPSVVFKESARSVRVARGPLGAILEKGELADLEEDSVFYATLHTGLASRNRGKALSLTKFWGNFESPYTVGRPLLKLYK